MIAWLDACPLWWMGILLLAVAVLPILILGEGSVFSINDQLDESILNYVLTARHLGSGDAVFEELLGGVNASGMEPSAVLFVPLYVFLPTFSAFVIQYALIFLCAFFGMYFLIQKLTGSHILSLASAGCFAMLPFYIVYGLSQAGIPLLLYGAICLYEDKKKPLGFALVALYGLTSHLVYTGYTAVGFWSIVLVILFLRKQKKWAFLAGWAELLLLYLLTNYRLFLEILLGQSTYVSHREEQVNGAMHFWEAFWEIFTQSTFHADSLHKYLILPIVLLLTYGVIFGRGTKEERNRLLVALVGAGLLVFCALFYAFCKSQLVVDFKNSQTGFLRYFQADRLYWIYPAGWYIEFALCCNLYRNRKGGRLWESPLVKLCVFAIVLLPTVNEIIHNSYFYRNVNQYNNGSAITGYISWESFYSEDLMEDLEEAIGKDLGTYRVAHLGINPTPALLHGFYTVDGYSNNYSLDYKHAFRKVIAAELEKAPETAVYFDTWGNRCYCYNSATGNAYMLGKSTNIVYEGLDFDMGALEDLGCEYLFSCGEIANAEELGLVSMGYYETATSYWGVWLYALSEEA